MSNQPDALVLTKPARAGGSIPATPKVQVGAKKEMGSDNAINARRLFDDIDVENMDVAGNI